MNLRTRLDRILNDVEDPLGRRFAFVIQSLIVLSVVVVTLDTFRDLPANVRWFINWLDYIILLIFSAEYVLRLWASRPRLKYAFSIWGLIDFLAVAPFWLLGSNTQIMRALRLFRLAKILRNTRFAKAMELYARALHMVRDEIAAFLAISLLLLYLTAYGIWQFESAAQPDKFANMFDAFWWAVITLTTVGYGDVYPVTVGGRIFTILTVLLGLGLVAVPSGLMASAFQEIHRQRKQERKQQRQKDHRDDA